MSDLSAVDAVVSGAPYLVRSVGGEHPRTLDDFVAPPVVKVVVERGAQRVTIHGEARRSGSEVLVFEKNDGGVGKDVRTWRIVQDGADFVAVERSTF